MVGVKALVLLAAPTERSLSNPAFCGLEVFGLYWVRFLMALIL